MKRQALEIPAVIKCAIPVGGILDTGVFKVILFYPTTEQDDETPENSAADVSNGRSMETSPGPWFDRILGAFVCLFSFFIKYC